MVLSAWFQGQLQMAFMNSTLESDHFSWISGCIKLEGDISMRNIFCLNKNGLRGRIIWQGPRKVSEISHKNKVREWTKFKNFFARLMGMTKVNFRLSNFFCSGHFLTYFLRCHGSKNDQSQKSYFNEKSVFSCLSTWRRNFWIFFMLWLYFDRWFLKL